jgi:ER lumen protein retaining receptor
MKVIFISATLSIIWYMRKHRAVSQTYCKEEDTFKMEYLIVPCFLLALLVNHELSVMEARAACSHAIPACLSSPAAGAVDVLHLPGGGGYSASAGDAAELGECG